MYKRQESDYVNKDSAVGIGLDNGEFYLLDVSEDVFMLSLIHIYITIDAVKQQKKRAKEQLRKKLDHPLLLLLVNFL